MARQEKPVQLRTIPKVVVTDLELIQVATQAELDLEKDIHLFIVIEDIIFKHKNEKWEFRYGVSATV